MPMAAEWFPINMEGSLAPKGCRWQKLLYREVPGVKVKKYVLYLYIEKRER